MRADKVIQEQKHYSILNGLLDVFGTNKQVLHDKSKKIAMNKPHTSVLLQESIHALDIKQNGIYIDGTYGRGGHAKAILDALSAEGKLIAIDKDKDAISHAKANFGNDTRFSIHQESFADIDKVADKEGVVGKVSGILLDLGVSSPQLDESARGFSFMNDGPLDMRMDTNQELSASKFVNEASVGTLSQIFRDYGEEKFHWRIANAIVNNREESPITTTQQLAEIVKKANPKWEKHKHPATRVFQAIRIYVNNELNDVRDCLEKSVNILAPNGRLAVISFHSLEDRIVKNFLRDKERGVKLPKNIPITADKLCSDFKRIGKAIKPSFSEVATNVRARSAILRVGEKVK